MILLKNNRISFFPIFLFLVVVSRRQATCFSSWKLRTTRHQLNDSSIICQSTAFSVTPRSRDEGKTIMDDTLMPKKQYSNRIGLGRDAQGIGGGSALDPNDPRLSMTYAEFPLDSLDELVDVGMKHLQKDQVNFVDIGSGCGRIALYLAMTRQNWDVHGIEISKLLHEQATEYLEKAMEQNFFSDSTSVESGSLALHLGPAAEFYHLLGQADCIFAYSTAFSAKSFSPELGALLLDPEWSNLLSESCKTGCVAITTDRALDPAYGWELVDRLDVENQEVFGSTGYIHILRR